MTCSWCERKLRFISVVRGNRYCSEEHKEFDGKQMRQLALQRLMEVLPKIQVRPLRSRRSNSPWGDCSPLRLNGVAECSQWIMFLDMDLTQILQRLYDSEINVTITTDGGYNHRAACAIHDAGKGIEDPFPGFMSRPDETRFAQWR